MFQQLNGAWVPCALTSKKLPDAATRYRVVEKEAYAIVHAAHTWSMWLRGVQFELYSDHRAVECLVSGKHAPPSGRLARWAELLGQFTFTLKWVPGKTHSILLADYLSRLSAANEPPLRHEALMECTEQNESKEEWCVPRRVDDGIGDEDGFWSEEWNIPAEPEVLHVSTEEEDRVEEAQQEEAPRRGMARLTLDSHEPPSESAGQKMLNAITGKDSHHVRTGKRKKGFLQREQRAALDAYEAPLHSCVDEDYLEFKQLWEQAMEEECNEFKESVAQA